jgi:hypothetical protein
VYSRRARERNARMLLFLESDDQATKVLCARAQILPVAAALRQFEQRANLNGQRPLR